MNTSAEDMHVLEYHSMRCFMQLKNHNLKIKKHKKLLTHNTLHIHVIHATILSSFTEYCVPTTMYTLAYATMLQSKPSILF